jgi:hypothetical protein
LWIRFCLSNKMINIIFTLGFCKWNSVIIFFYTLQSGILFQDHTETPKTYLQKECDWESTEWSDRSNWSLHKLRLCAVMLICEAVWNKLHAYLPLLQIVTNLTTRLLFNMCGWSLWILR